MEYEHIHHAQLAQDYKSGANWFYWIAGLTIVTSLITFGGGGFRFLFGLGSTQLIDAFAAVLATRLGSAVQIVALVLDLFVAGLFVVFGWLANKKNLWVYGAGIAAFLLDGIVPLLSTDLIGILAHVVVLFFLIRGFMKGRELLALEKTMGQEAAMPQTEAAL